MQDPTNSQSLNRYSYCWINPLTFTDPTGYRTWWDNFKAWTSKNKNAIITTVVTVAVATIVTVATGGLGAPVAAFLGGMAGGFTGGMVGARLNGASWSQAWDAALMGMVIGGVSAGFTAGIGGAMQGAFLNITNTTLQTIAREGTRALLHGAVQGYFTMMQGGDFWSGFAAGAFSSAAGSLVQGFQVADKIGTVGMVGVGALSGGLAAELSGGDFGLGAISGAWVVLFNHLSHDVKRLIERAFGKINGLRNVYVNEAPPGYSIGRDGKFYNLNDGTVALGAELDGNIYLSPSAMKDPKLMFLVAGHELVHVLHRNAGLDMNSLYGRQQTEYFAWRYTEKLANVLGLNNLAEKAYSVYTYQTRYSPAQIDKSYENFKLPFWP